MRRLRRKRNGPEESIEKLVERYRDDDDQPPEPDQRKREEKAIENLEKDAQRSISSLSSILSKRDFMRLIRKPTSSKREC